MKKDVSQAPTYLHFAPPSRTIFPGPVVDFKSGIDNYNFSRPYGALEGKAPYKILRKGYNPEPNLSR